MKVAVSSLVVIENKREEAIWDKKMVFAVLTPDLFQAGL
jgi:hypothetical protein